MGFFFILYKKNLILLDVVSRSVQGRYLRLLIIPSTLQGWDVPQTQLQEFSAPSAGQNGTNG